MSLNINSAWSAASAVLKNIFSFYDIKEIVGLAGFDTGTIAHLVQQSGSSVSKGQLISEIEQQLSTYSIDDKRHFLNIVIEEMLSRCSAVETRVEPKYFFYSLVSSCQTVVKSYDITYDILKLENSYDSLNS